MKKSFYGLLMWLSGMIILGACEKEAKNPGDYSIPTTLSVLSLEDSLGTVYQLLEDYRKDTTYLYMHVESDTLFEADGITPQIDNAGKMIINKDTTYSPGNTKGLFVAYKVIMLPSDSSTIKIKITSNARWKANLADKSVFFKTLTSGGGGDATIRVASLKNPWNISTPESFYTHQLIYTSDTTIMYDIVLGMEGSVPSAK